MHCYVKNIFFSNFFVPEKFICIYKILFKNLLNLLRYRWFMCRPFRGDAVSVCIWILSNYIAYTRQLICFHFYKHCGYQDYFFWLRASKLTIQGKEKGSEGKWHSFISHEANCLFHWLVFRRRGIKKMD